jgi:hypothetical protein
MMTIPKAFARLNATLCALLLLAFAGTASSMSIRELRGLEKSSKQGTIYVQYYLIGVMEGVMEASHAAQRQGGQALACVNDRRLEPSMAQSLYQAELRRNADLYEADMPVQLVMLNALASAYAC